MDGTTSSYFPMDVGKKVLIHLPEGRMWSTVRGWKPGQCVLLDMPEGEPQWSKIDIGIPCRVQYVREGVWHHFESLVSSRWHFPGGGEMLSLTFPARVESRSLRSAPRVKVEIPAQLHGLSGDSLSCMILDISRSGLRLETPLLGFRPGDQLEISCLLPNQSPLVDAPGIVRRSYNPGRFGVEFGSLTDRQREALEDYLSIFTSVRSLEGIELAKQGMLGYIEDISLPDLLMILVNSRRAYRLDLNQSSRWGHVHVEEGEVRHAQTSNREGPAALFELFSWSKGRYQIQTVTAAPDRNVYAPLEHLLLEFAYLQDMDSECGNSQGCLAQTMDAGGG